LGVPDEPDVTGKRPPCLARVREPSPPPRAGNPSFCRKRGQSNFSVTP